MKSKSILTLSLALLSTLNFQLSTFAQGSLTPPGAPAPTMKTLSQVEPRTPVNSLSGDSENIFIINQPGSYYLTTNIVVLGATNGLRIAANDVVVDLNGFTLFGPRSRTAINTAGVNINRIRIRNGQLSGWASGINFYSNGQATNAVLEDLQIDLVAGAFDYGIASGDAARILRCSISGATGASSYGILTGARSVIESCGIANCAYGVVLGALSTIRNSLVKDCTAVGADGILTSNGCDVQNNLVDGCYTGITLRDFCTATDNRSENSITGSGFNISGNGSRVENNFASGNASRGFTLSSGTNNVIIRNFARGNNSGNFNLDGNQASGPVITGTGTITNSNPWANFSL